MQEKDYARKSKLDAKKIRCEKLTPREVEELKRLNKKANSEIPDDNRLEKAYKKVKAAAKIIDKERQKVLNKFLRSMNVNGWEQLGKVFSDYLRDRMKRGGVSSPPIKKNKKNRDVLRQR